MSNPPHDTEAEWAAMPQAHDYLKKASVIAGATGLEHLFYILDTADAYTTDDAHLVLIHKQEQLAEIATRTPTWYLERTHVNDGVCMSVYTKRSGPANF
jgi:methylase of polypeptide subunit release factors